MSSFALEPKLEASTLSVALTGSVLMTDVVEFNDTLREHSKTPGIKQLVLDMSGVERMDFSGLGALVSLNTSMQRYGRRLVLQRVPELVEKLMERAEIEGFFPMCDSKEELTDFLAELNRRN